MAELDSQLRQYLEKEIGSLAMDMWTGLDVSENDDDSPINWGDEFSGSTNLGYAEDNVHETMPTYTATFHLAQDLQTGIFHSSNPVRLDIDLLGADRSIRGQVELFVELIGGNFPQSAEDCSGSPCNGFARQVSSSECCARLRIWSHPQDDDRRVFVTSCFWPKEGLMADRDGVPITIENRGAADDPELDSTTRWSSHRPNLPEHHPSAKGCSILASPALHSRPTFEFDECFSLPSAAFYQDLDEVYMAIWAARNWRVQSSKLPETVVQTIASAILKRFCVKGILAVGVGVISAPNSLVKKCI